MRDTNDFGNGTPEVSGSDDAPAPSKPWSKPVVTPLLIERGTGTGGGSAHDNVSTFGS